MKKIVYVVGGLYSLTGMNSILSKKINWLAENTNYKLYMILTEKPDLPWVFDINPKVNWVNFNINFDELDTMPIYKKAFFYYFKQRKYKRLFSNYLTKIKPDITISAIRREINFINSIKDGSKKIGEIHFTREFYRTFYMKCFPQKVNTLISKLWMKSLLKQIKKLERFVVLTEEDSNHWPELRNKMVIPNFIPEYHEELSTLENKSAIAVGRYSWEKGIDLLIEAWALVAYKHPDWHLNIYGTGNLLPFQEIVHNKRLNNMVSCHPACSDIYKKYRESSIFVLSSRHEGFGLVLLEAMSVGVPPVSFACPCGPRNIINNGIDGILVKKEDIRELADAICYMIENPEIRKEIAHNAVLKSKQYPPSIIMKKWINLFESL